MASTLILKTGASGDVVRSTVLLHAIAGDVYWITKKYNKFIFPDSHPALKEIVPIDQVPAHFFDKTFDHIINLEEDIVTAKLAQSFTTGKRTGIYLNDSKLAYTPDSSGWYDMSLVSVHGMAKANELKYTNRKSYQEHLYEMLGKKFAGEKYVIYGQEISRATRNGKMVGIERRSGTVWPNKQWGGYDELARALETKGYEIFFLSDQPTLRQYMADVHQCDLLICGDTLCMHLALGYEIPCISVFNCTSPQEIYSYGILSKVVSPLLHEAFYQTSTRSDVINSVRIEDVLQKVEEWELKCIRL